MTLLIRGISGDDLAALVEIEHQSFVQPHWGAEAFLQYDPIAAEIGGRLVGFLVSRETFPGNGENPPEREILNLAVSPAYRRMGIASALLKHDLERPGVHFLEVRESNVAAQALYRKLGFMEIGRRYEYYERPPEAAIVMKIKKC